MGCENGISRSGEKGRKGSNSGCCFTRQGIHSVSLDPQGYCGGPNQSTLAGSGTRKLRNRIPLLLSCSEDASTSASILVLPCLFLGLSFSNGLLSFCVPLCHDSRIVLIVISILPAPDSAPSQQPISASVLIDELPRAPFISCPAPSTHLSNQPSAALAWTARSGTSRFHLPRLIIASRPARRASPASPLLFLRQPRSRHHDDHGQQAPAGAEREISTRPDRASSRQQRLRRLLRGKSRYA